MKCKCGSTQFYIKEVCITDDILSENMSGEDLLSQVEDGFYVNYNYNYNYSKGWLSIKCSGCEKVLATNK